MMNSKNVKQISKVILSVVGLMLLGPTAVLADTTAAMPWDAPLQILQKSFTGPVATTMSVFAIVGCGLGIAFGEGGQGMKKLLWVIIGVAIALLSARLLTGLNLGAGLTF